MFPSKEKIVDWNKAHEYHCYVDCDSTCVFKGPFSIERTNHLQRVLGESNVLQVHFAEELFSQQVDQNGRKQSTPCKPNVIQLKRFQKMAKEGIFVGLRRYKFFAFKDSGRKAKTEHSPSSSVKCYFVRTESFAESDRNSSYILFNKSIHEARCMFMHAHTVSTLKKYMARFSLVLSQTMCFSGDISNVDIKHIKDIPCMDEQMNPVYDINGEPMIHTDGTGFISKDLALQCPKNVFKGKTFDEDSKLLKYFKPSTPWRRPIQDLCMPQQKPMDFSHEELEEKLIEEYINLRFSPSNVTGIAAESWLTFIDRLLTPGVEDPKERQTLKDKMMKLVDIFYESVDAPKTGKQVEVPEDLCPRKKPHFLNKNLLDEDFARFYTSSSILGEIYDLKVSDITLQSDEIWTIPCFQNTDVEFKDKWRKYYSQYRREMTQALRSNNQAEADAIVPKYKKILYGSTSLSSSTKPKKELYLEASALYQVVYEYAKEKKDIGKCLFAWRVAGEALCDLYLQSQKEDAILISPSILYESIS